MKCTLHISYFYLEERIKYINAIIDETNRYEIITDIFIHTNVNISAETFNKYTNGSIQIICHDLSNIHPFYLTWKCRDLLKQQKDEYDIFMYIEDDILVPYKAIKYWLEYNTKLIEDNYNLGFMRIEVENNIDYITDITVQLYDSIMLDKLYCMNNINPYCAFWIYNKNEFHRFVNSKYYCISTITNYDIREMSAIGLHGLYTNWYKCTLIPMIDNKLNEDCKIYHMPNNYVSDKSTLVATIKFDEAIKQHFQSV